MKTIKQMESEMRLLERQKRKIDDRIFNLSSRLWAAKCAAIKPEDMCRRRWTAGYECAQKKGHDQGPNATCCQGQAPPIPEPPPKYRKQKYHWLPRGVDFSGSNMTGVVPCEYCGWPVADCGGEYSWFHLMGRFGEEPRGCDWPAPAKTKKMMV